MIEARPGRRKAARRVGVEVTAGQILSMWARPASPGSNPGPWWPRRRRPPPAAPHRRPWRNCGYDNDVFPFYTVLKCSSFEKCQPWGQREEFIPLPLVSNMQYIVDPGYWSACMLEKEPRRSSMKKYLLFSTALILLFSTSYSVRAESLPDEFGELKFGSPVPEELAHKEKTKISNHNKNYTIRTSRRDQFFGVDVKWIDYVFVNDIFYKARFETEAMRTDQYQHLVSKVSARYGPPLLAGILVQGEIIDLWEQGDKSIRFHTASVSNNMTIVVEMSQLTNDMKCSCIKP
jgi:hypothetical protein